MTGLSSTRCPTSFELGAALRVATVLDAGGTRRAAASASYALIPTGGVYRQEHFAKAQSLLERCELLRMDGEFLRPSSELLEISRLPVSQAMELLLLATVERAPPVWLFAACEGVELAPEAIPDEDWAVFETVIGDPTRREEFLLALGRRFDSEEAGRVGADGELFVVERCKHELTRLGYPRNLDMMWSRRRQLASLGALRSRRPALRQRSSESFSRGTRRGLGCPTRGGF